MYLINMVRTQIPRMEQNASTMIDLWGASHDVIQRAKTTKEDCNELAEEISLVLKVRGDPGETCMGSEDDGGQNQRRNCSLGKFSNICFTGSKGGSCGISSSDIEVLDRIRFSK
ncbi:uncharacterized protein LOC109136358 isoform X1 [Beta vulgaris subsp. vulgaris]|uniref:uncharacterized protein LOC109136358 isoform X1 n=1 Tax=Beta vulgaris subsp. vulgaris TaxID=3555 RepID=UPI0020370235|nr:uncharacterized protein LOC109136358 isoform X1 [Beta vulgaris subsp. vulgaris]